MEAGKKAMDLCSRHFIVYINGMEEREELRNKRSGKESEVMEKVI